MQKVFSSKQASCLKRTIPHYPFIFRCPTQWHRMAFASDQYQLTPARIDPPRIVNEHKQSSTNIGFVNVAAPEVHLVDFGENNNIVSYSDFLRAIDKDRVAHVTVNERLSTIDLVTKDAEAFVSIKIPKDNDNLIDMLIDRGVDVKYASDDGSLFQKAAATFQLLFQALFFGLVLYSMISFIRVSTRGGNSASFMNFGKSTATVIAKKNADEIGDDDITFADVAGLDCAKDELMDIIDYLKAPEKFVKLGAKAPKGILLVGPPGCGKTLLARAIANMTHAKFFYISASEFIQMFVGVGASRVRDLFEEAKKDTPSIIFIDEIDAVGKSRSSGPQMGGGSNDEREQTINQLLTEMDGFKPNNGVLVLAATNRADVLDAALLRPGRFDRQVQIELPDFRGRCEILKVHCKNKPLTADVCLDDVAKQTVGFSGADLYNVCNEAAIIAARRAGDVITKNDFDEAMEKLTIGLAKVKTVITDKKKHIIAVHESGHAIVALALADHYDDLKKVTIVPRGSAGGVTLFSPSEENLDMSLLTRKYFENQIMVALGGRAAEQIVFGESMITTGASSDMKRVHEIAYRMVTVFGFSDVIGPISLNQYTQNYSESLRTKIDAEVKSIVDKGYQSTLSLLSRKRKILDELTIRLVKIETIDGVEAKAIYDAMNDYSSL